MKRLAHAKLNLFLRVVGRRPDGFHELETVFQSIDLADELNVSPADDLRLTGGSAEAPPGPENLVLRAAVALREAAGVTGGAALHLEKRIPVGAGLGGGSSDAAAALRALNQLWNLDLPDARLATLAAELGSDVPFALRGGTAVGRGRGELLEPLPTPALCFVLIRPPFPVPTARAYGLYQPAPSDGPSLDTFVAALASGDPTRLALVLRNDLEPGVFGAWPELGALRERLLTAGAVGARMTGSGSVLFGLARDERHAREVAAQIEEPGMWVRAARSVALGLHDR
jgi:4-diphosphocytidyl-2-C-methyl-D-erythritol kinase